MFTEEGYIDCKQILDKGYIYNIIIGGRGIGKTYSALKTVLNNNTFFVYMRRTQTQLDMINTESFNPIKAISSDVHVKKINKNCAAYIQDDTIIGYTFALSTFSNLRGFDVSEVEVLIYDEFIPEPHEKKIKKEAQAFFNAYETMNRNRELFGKKPIKVLLLSNANDISNDIFIELNLSDVIEKNLKKGKNIYQNEEKSLFLAVLGETKIGTKKMETSLYKLLKNNSYVDMSILNKFKINSGEVISRKIIEYKLLCKFSNIGIYIHKSNGKYYVKNEKEYMSVDDIERIKFSRDYHYLWTYFLQNKVEFETLSSKKVFTNIYLRV